MSNDEQEYKNVTPDMGLVKKIMADMGMLFDNLVRDSEDKIGTHVAILAALDNHFVNAHKMLADMTGMPPDKTMFNFDGMQRIARDRIMREIGLHNANETDPHKH